MILTDGLKLCLQSGLKSITVVLATFILIGLLSLLF